MTDHDKVDPDSDAPTAPGTPREPGSEALLRPHTDHRSDTLIGETIGHFTIKRVIGAGGMGTVYEALQETPRRTVALKVMRTGLASRSALRRFEYEVQVLARLRHPGIAQIFEAGTDDKGEGGTPWFAMEYLVAAKTITDFATAKQLSMSDRLALFAKVCNAAHHGHQKGVIHRDLKPGNILVTSHGDPKIIDFGVARSTDSDLAVTTLQTDMGALIGTLQYMSPEQCAADPHDIDVRSDVYALGVVLYELLTDGTPYDVTNQAIHEAARIVREDPPTKPSTVNRVVRGDIETICLKALEKDRDRRYQSALSLEQDIQRYLDGEPIAARRPTLTYQLKLLYQRHRAVSVLSLVLIGLLIASVVALTWLATGQAIALRESERQARRSQAIIDGITLLITSPSTFDGENLWDTTTTWKTVLDNGRKTVEWEAIDTPANATHALHVGYFRLVLAMGYLNCRANAEALSLTQDTTLELQKWFPKNDPNLLDAHIMEAKALMATGRKQEAAALGNSVLAAKIDQLGAESPDTLGAAWEVAMLCAEAGMWADAQKICESSLGDGSILRSTYVKQAIDLLQLLNTLPLDDRPMLVQSAHEHLLQEGSHESLAQLLELVNDELGFTPRADAALATLDAMKQQIGTLGPQSDLQRAWRIHRGHALEGLGRLDEANAMFQSQAERDAGRTNLDAWDRNVVQAALQRIT